MSGDLSVPAARADVDEIMESALADADVDCLAPARAAVFEAEDRWYGDLLLAVHGAADGDGPPPLPAAASIELLRAYCRVRADLLVRVDEADAGDEGATPALLAGDYLYAAAYATLDGVRADRRRGCFDVLSDVSETVIEAFAAVRPAEVDSGEEFCSLVDRTAGALGAGAAALGATLAGADGDRRDSLAAVGRDLAAVRYLLLALGSRAPVGEDAPDERAVRRCVERRRAAVDRSLGSLPGDLRVDSLRSFADAALSEAAGED